MAGDYGIHFKPLASYNIKVKSTFTSEMYNRFQNQVQQVLASFTFWIINLFFTTKNCVKVLLRELAELTINVH